MKKVFLSIFLSCAAIGFSNAQQSIGGIPWSISKKAALDNQKVSVLSLPTPNFEKAKQEDEYSESIGRPGKYRVALGVQTDINLDKGTITYLADGSRIWRLQVAIPSSLGLKVGYDNFYLPPGVTYFVQNGNKNQLIGGYDYTSNPNSQTMAHEMVQGDVMNLEMDIQPNVDMSRIQLQINHVYGLYRGANEVNRTFADASVQATYALGESDTCQVNINCDQARLWYTLSHAAAHIWITDGTSGGFCSGTLISNTANDCTPLFLTASHCDDANAYSSAHFSQWEFTFDFRAPLCAGGGTPNTSKVLKGADFQARSYYTIPAGLESGPLYGDFLLLKIKDPANKIKEWNRVLAGWDRRDLITDATGTKLDTVWVDFHHPSGDVMKFTKFNAIDSLGAFNTDSAGTHWMVTKVIGGSQPGSSGSGLWQGSHGRLIGDLSGGVTPPDARICTPNMKAYAPEFSKISHNWTNDHDIAYYNDSITVNNSRLAPFLDPKNLAPDHIDMVQASTSDCKVDPFILGVTAINDVKVLENGISLYPNPSTGLVTMTLNLEKAQTLNVDLVNILGQKLNGYVIKNASVAQQANFDLSSYPNGIYLFKISSNNVTVTKKVVVRK